ncbi:class I SAM-dependent methyltransferase family protein [Candidatus Woesearchaeota archaeon]|nr:class I SAM-dependent methyltransferase family protein [Candidatus Woesearchaeota archaeon]
MKKNLKHLLKDVLSNEELEMLPTSFDVVGDIVIFADFPQELVEKEKKIGSLILENFKNVNVVLKKTEQYSDEFRTPKLEVIAGEDRKETLHKENNIRLKLDVEKVYFSARMSTERKRISELVRDDENVLVMFSGCAPYVCVIAKNSKPEGVVGIELNPVGHEYALENVKLNKLSNVNLINGDVRVEVPKLKEVFDRILMPLPKSAEDFLDLVLLVAKKDSIIHFYDFLHENDFELAYEKVRNACKKSGVKPEFIELVKCGQYAPRTFRVCLDFKIV